MRFDAATNTVSKPKGETIYGSYVALDEISVKCNVDNAGNFAASLVRLVSLKIPCFRDCYS